MVTVKDRNGRDLVNTEEIKRWKKYSEWLYKKDLNEPDNYNGVVSPPESDILECELKWTLGNTTVSKASGCDGSLVELFKTLKDDCYQSVASLVAQTVKYLSIMWETRVRSLGWEDPLEKEMAAHSSTPAWKIPWIEEPGGLQAMGSQRVRHDWVTPPPPPKCCTQYVSKSERPSSGPRTGKGQSLSQ